MIGYTYAFYLMLLDVKDVGVDSVHPHEPESSQCKNSHSHTYGLERDTDPGYTSWKKKKSDKLDKLRSQKRFCSIKGMYKI